MPGLTFLNAVFLAGLVAAALPVIIHLLHRQPARPLEFSWLRFVKALEPSRTRRVRLTEYLLLAVRVLLLMCLCLALARPTLKGGLLGSGQARTTVSIVVDDSYSMGARVEGRRLFDRAKERAREVLSLLGPGDDAILVLARKGPKVPIGEPVRDVAFVERRIENLEVSAMGGDAAAALREAAVRLERSPNLNKEIYFVTDSQAASFGASADTGAIELDPDISLYWLTVGDLPAENVAIERVERVETLGGGSDSWLLQAVVRNLGVEPKRSVLVELESGGEVRDQALVDLDGGAAASVLLRMAPPGSGPAAGQVRLAEDALALDDVRYFSLASRESRRVLVVSGGATVPGGRRAGFFVERALDPEGDATAGVRVASVRASEISSSDLEAADVVVLTDVGRLESVQVDLLRQFVRRGGGLLILAGPSMDLGFYNRTLLPEFLDLSLVGPEGDVRGSGFFELRVLRGGHPIFEAWGAEAARLVGDVHFRRVMKTRVGADASVLAEFANVGPALVEGASGAGKVLLFTSSADPAWTDFPLSGGFLPFVHEAVRYLSGASGRDDGAYLVGGSASVVLDGGEGGAVVGVDPAGEELLLEPRIMDGRPRVRWGSLELPGLYTLRWGQEEVGRFAANVETDESTLEVMAPEEIAARIRSDRLRFMGPQAEIETEVAALRYGRELGSGFLWAAMGFLALESLLIRGRRRSESGDRLRRELFR